MGVKQDRNPDHNSVRAASSGPCAKFPQRGVSTFADVARLDHRNDGVVGYAHSMGRQSARPLRKRNAGHPACRSWTTASRVNPSSCRRPTPSASAVKYQSSLSSTGERQAAAAMAGKHSRLKRRSACARPRAATIVSISLRRPRGLRSARQTAVPACRPATGDRVLGRHHGQRPVLAFVQQLKPRAPRVGRQCLRQPQPIALAAERFTDGTAVGWG
jgi:hypothetical protein